MPEARARPGNGAVKYTETRVYTTTAGVEPVTALLMRKGIDGVSVEDSGDLRSVIEAKDWLGWDYIDERLIGEANDGPVEVVLTFYTDDSGDGASLRTEIKTELMMLKADEQYGEYGANADFGRLYAESEALSDEWKDKWKEGFKAFRASDRVVVRPAWDPGERLEKREGDIVIAIDPGMAFGTGTHETTAMCLDQLERCVRFGASVLDIGTGSGILAIAAVMLGASRVTAVEYDADAAASASSNIATNGVSDSVDLVEGDIRELAETIGAHDVVVANVTSGLIDRIAGSLPALVARGGKLVVSGLLVSDEKRVRDALKGAGFAVNSPETRGEWLTICADFS
jgi:ribosomal protein L11 methyltransferase